MRQDNIRLFELGLGTNNINVLSNMGINGKPGASLYGWRTYFPNSMVFGADIDKNILIQHPKIKTFYCDQTNIQSIKELWEQPLLQEDNFDIIIEDGLHEFYANVCFFENSIHKLKHKGYYIIEDIKNSDIGLFKTIINNEWKQKYTDLSFKFRLNKYINRGDNNLLVVQKI
jgi:hypothetical protein